MQGLNRGAFLIGEFRAWGAMISRAGHVAILHARYMLGMVALRHNPILKTFGERPLASGYASKAVIGAAMKKRVHLIYGICPPGLHDPLESRPHERLSVAGRLKCILRSEFSESRGSFVVQLK